MQADLKSMTYPELESRIRELGEKAFRAAQLFSWMHRKAVLSFDEMSNLPKAFREQLKEKARLTILRQEQVQISAIDGTRKYLFALDDGNVIESVLMRYEFGNSVCISTQAGCRMGCRFCASAIGGMSRNLTPAEMLEQVYRISADTGERVSHVVLMGTGEPFDNYENVIRFLELISDERGLNIGKRNLTLSTCGLVPQIYAFADLKPQATLALSLHAPNDEIRRTLMPVANRYPLSEVLEACRYFSRKTGRRMTYEYSLVSGVNDRDEDALALAALLKGDLCHVNLIPVNPVKERSYSRSGRGQVEKFRNILEKNGINATIRREMGRDIDGACGQLRRKYITEGSTEASP